MDANSVLGPFARWSPTALTVGGGGLFGLFVVAGAGVAGFASSPAWLHMVLLIGGLWFVFLGLVGFYPTIAGESPRLSTVGAVTAALGGAALTITLVAAAVVDLTSQRTFAQGPTWGPPVLAVAFVLALVSFLVYGGASLRTETPSRTAGLLLLVPVTAFLGQAVLLIAKIGGSEVSGVLQLILAGVTAVAVIAFGHTLRADGNSLAGSESVRDTPT